MGSWGTAKRHLVTLLATVLRARPRNGTAVRLGAKFGYIDRTGATVIAPQFDETGKTVIEPRFDGVDAFSDGRATVYVWK